MDTSVLIEMLAGRMAPRLSERDLAGLAICGPVAQEVLQGLRRDPVSEAFRETLFAMNMLADPLPSAYFLRAADMYRQLREKGYAIRSSTDCLIAAIAIEHGVPIWHRDRDFDTIARFTALRCEAPA